eukprot:TRINITY_DN1670_c0_g1_i3.p1 TRINITY_DN1670_c0_g1~~TRINITY_DN1670_c0_g1_i3.p1  ORF type:complete len:527 (-),score=54.78 TRINITY_DN1670_c0_g1_i3:470-2005(-)
MRQRAGDTTSSLTMAKLRQAVTAEKKKIPLHIPFCYADHDATTDLRNETDEFYASCEFAHSTCARTFRSLWPSATSWCDPDNGSLRQAFIETHLEHLDRAVVVDRRSSAMALLYLAQGLGEPECDKAQQQVWAKTNNQLLNYAGAYTHFLQCFHTAKCQAESQKSQMSDGITADHDLRLYANLLYMLILHNHDDEDLTADLVHCQQPKSLVFILIDMLLYYNDHRTNIYPLKKVVLLFWKCLLYGFGNQKQISHGNGVDTQNNNPVVKHSAQEYQMFSESVKQYHQTRFSMSRAYDDLPVPFAEARGLLRAPDDTTRGPTATGFEGFYYLLLPHLRKVTIILMTTLLHAKPLSTFSPDAAVPSALDHLDIMSEIMADDGIPSDVERRRHFDIMSKGISAVLVLLLVHSRANSKMQFEHVGQVMVDAKAILLVLKALNNDVQALLSSPSLLLCDLRQPEEDVRISYCRFLTLVNLLRLLQKLTKGNHYRTQTLVTYHSQVIIFPLFLVAIGF